MDTGLVCPLFVMVLLLLVVLLLFVGVTGVLMAGGGDVEMLELRSLLVEADESIAESITRTETHESLVCTGIALTPHCSQQKT